MKPPQETVTLLINKHYLPSPDLFDLSSEDIHHLLDSLSQKIPTKEKPLILHKDVSHLLHSSSQPDINWLEFEKSRVLYEKGKNQTMYRTFLELFTPSTPLYSKPIIQPLPLLVQQPEHNITPSPEPSSILYSNVQLIESYQDDPQKRTVKDFVSYFRVRYQFLKDILQQRLELRDTVSVSRALQKKDNESVSLIGLVYDKVTTGNNNLLITLEDVTGLIKVLINHNNQQLFALAEKTCVDEVIGITGTLKHSMVFVNALLFPDVPIPQKESQKIDHDVFAAFISDIHFGSKDFLEHNFLRFIEWTHGKSSFLPQHNILSPKLKYLFILGDVVDGVGVYPGQEKNLHHKDICEQYKLAYRCISQIRPDIQIIVCPGNHDASRATEPQPPISNFYAPDLHTLPNIHLVSNPCFVNIHASKTSEGFTVLMYHGASFHYYIDNIPQLRQNKARDHPGQILQLLLQKRHLAPAHSSTTYVPCANDDPLLIKKIPDLIVSGDMHKSDISSYHGVLLINSSCWQRKTDYQEKTGNNPDPCKVPLLNLRTKEVTTLDFSDLPS